MEVGKTYNFIEKKDVGAARPVENRMREAETFVGTVVYKGIAGQNPKDGFKANSQFKNLHFADVKVTPPETGAEGLTMFNRRDFNNDVDDTLPLVLTMNKKGGVQMGPMEGAGHPLFSKSFNFEEKSSTGGGSKQKRKKSKKRKSPKKRKLSKRRKSSKRRR